MLRPGRASLARARIAALAGCLAILAATLGCGTVSPHFRAPSRYKHGVVFILPGIEGRSVWNADLATGLDDGGVTSAIEIYDWTIGLPGGLVFNLTDLERNRRQAGALVNRIVEYRSQHPGAPVHLIGHSGGGGIAVLALEALPAGRQIDMAILLAPALSQEYDLSTALRRTRYGILNFYSSQDVGLLVIGTSVFGPIDRHYGAAAGALGFKPPPDQTDASARLYRERLRQIGWSEKLSRHGASGSHVGWTSQRFASEYLAPVIKDNEARSRLAD